MGFCYDQNSTGLMIDMTLDTQHDRRSNRVTAKILDTVFAMRRTFGTAAAKNLLLRIGHDDAFVEQVLAIPGERRAQRRRTDAAPAERSAATAAPDDDAVTLDAAGMAVLHRLRFEADSGMHRMTLCECPPELARFGLMQPEPDGTPAITAKGRQALKHYACVRALDSIWRGVDAIPMSADIQGWLEANLFLQRAGSGYQVTDLGQSWLAFNAALSPQRPAS
jgi:hypothetical protein